MSTPYSKHLKPTNDDRNAASTNSMRRLPLSKTLIFLGMFTFWLVQHLPAALASPGDRAHLEADLRKPAASLTRQKAPVTPSKRKPSRKTSDSANDPDRASDTNRATVAVAKRTMEEAVESTAVEPLGGPSAGFPTREVAYMRYSIIPASRPRELSQTRFSGARMTVHDHSLSLAHGLVRNNGGTILINGFGYRVVGLQYTNLPSTIATRAGADAKPSNLYGLKYIFGLVQRLAKHWTLVLVATAGYYSDFTNWRWDALGLDARIFAVYEINPNLKVGFGAVYFSRLGKPLVFPAATLNWNIGHGFRLDLRPIREMAFRYIPHPRVAISLLGEYYGGRFRVNTKAMESETDLSGLGTAPGADPFGGQGPSVSEWFKTPMSYTFSMSQFTLGLDVKVRIWKGLYSFFKWGAVLYRKTEATDICVRSSEGKRVCRRKRRTFDMVNLGDDFSWLAGTGLEYRI